MAAQIKGWIAKTLWLENQIHMIEEIITSKLAISASLKTKCKPNNENPPAAPTIKNLHYVWLNMSDAEKQIGTPL